MVKIENAFPALPGWETVELIGRGSFGAVYEIRKTVLGGTERCALKHISIPRDESEILELRLEGQDWESITRTFTRQAESIVSEYRLMAQLNNCPNVVSSYDVEAVQKEGGYGWDILIRMELLTPLKKYLVQQQDYPETEILRLGREIGNALVACGRQRILHRDIKPENIMVAADGTYKLGDFGIARTAEKTGSATAQIGTYAYMAPEVYHGEHYDALADQYSLGMVLYWLLNGRRSPFVTVNTAEEKEAALRRRMSGEPIPAPLNGSPELKRIVLKCCAYDPKERFQSPEELINALDAVGAIHESPADRGKGRFASVGVGVSDDPQTMTDPNGLSRAPAPTTETPISAENETVGMFGTASGGPKPGIDTSGLSRAPAPTTEDEGTQVIPIVKTPRPEPEKPKQNKKILALLTVCALAAVLALILLLMPKGGQAPTNEPAETATLTHEPTPGETPGPTGEPSLSVTALDYENALALLESEQYEDAIAAFEALGDYEDSAERLTEAQTALAYENALALLEAGRYEEAIAAFEALGDYEDSAERLTEAQTALAYENALALLEAGQYEEAIATFEELGDYEDSVERLAEARNALAYAEADALAAEGKTYEAALAFSEIRDYRDAWDRCFALWGQITQRETISAGDDHTVGLRSDGTVLATEYNYYGQCDVSDWTDIVTISAVWNHTVGLRSDGTVVAVGLNTYGQCDVNDWTDIVAVSAGGLHTVGLRSDGTVLATEYAREYNYYGQCDVSDWTDIVTISAGWNHTVGLRSDGTVVAVGLNTYGQCDVNDWTDIVAVSAGGLHTVGLRSDGTVVAVGLNTYGQCDVNDWTDIVAISAGGYHTVGLRSDGTVVAVGYNNKGQCDVSDWTDIVAVSAGEHHTVGLKADGTVVAVGSNYHGQCDVGDWTDIALPEKRARN